MPKRALIILDSIGVLSPLDSDKSKELVAKYRELAVKMNAPIVFVRRPKKERGQ